MIKAPAAERNKQPILDVLSSLYPAEARGEVLEIASGTGQHVIHFAQHFKSMTFTPTDYDDASVEAITKNVSLVGLSNVRPPVAVDVSLPVHEWSPLVTERTYDLVICSNMIHISPWKCSQGLFAAAAQLLRRGSGRLMTYGPYAVDGLLTPDSNVQFDAYLRSQNPEWGVRDTRLVKQEAERQGFVLRRMIDMPANNKVLLFERRSSDSQHE